MDKSGAPELDIHLSVQLTRIEAEGLAYLCRVMEWKDLVEYGQNIEEATLARYALAKLRFALADAGFSAILRDEEGNLG